jgi:pheromone shutdown protein TraB
MEVLIAERNKVVVADVRRAATARHPVKSLVVFYGAGHMMDLERRLQADLGYRPTTNRWPTAFSVNPEQSGMSRFELGMVRQLVRRQLDLLRPVPGATNAP